MNRETIDMTDMMNETLKKFYSLVYFLLSLYSHPTQVCSSSGATSKSNLVTSSLNGQRYVLVTLKNKIEGLNLECGSRKHGSFDQTHR